ncbi:hypothetical protein [Paraburkholderia sp. J41]|uniref:hypothetical protein n=1 Tax=Paraburkholderia sp. J41 TaxID=2805433 RepID=UPI002AC32531|nr:hypothetical protein [Paraburkholderia sp. J41]
MTASKARCVIVAYNEDGEEVQTCTVDRAAVEKLMANALSVNWPLQEYGGKFDDEFARRIGGTALHLLAAYQPALKEHLAVTPAKD